MKPTLNKDALNKDNHQHRNKKGDMKYKVKNNITKAFKEQ